VKKIALALTIVSALLFSATAGIHAVKADSNDSVSFSSGTVVYCPLNRTYNSRFLTLNLTFGVGLGVNCSLTYDIDGKYEGQISLVAKNPAELHVVNQAIGLVELPELTNGSHRFTINVVCGLYDFHGANAPSAPFKRVPGTSDYEATWTHMVYFTIDTGAQTVDSTPPKISYLSMENKTYTTPDIPLNFTVSENASQVTYSLDGKENVTISGNTTLTGLSIGEHTLTVYARDDAGNIGASQTINFTVAYTTSPTPQTTIGASQTINFTVAYTTSPTPQTTEPFPAAIVVAASLAAVVAVSAGLLAYFKKTKHKAEIINGEC
jgi:hypothetical protein